MEGHDNLEGEPLHGHHAIEEESPNSDVELVEKEHLPLYLHKITDNFLFFPELDIIIFDIFLDVSFDNV